MQKMMKPASNQQIQTILLINLMAICCLLLSTSVAQPQQTRTNSLSSSSSSRVKPISSINSSSSSSKNGTSSNQPSQQDRSTRNTNSINNTARLSSSEFVEDELPVDFYEMPPEQLDLGMNATGRAPVPILNVAILQNGQMIDSAINVHPGAPLEMVIYLDDKSAKVYGLFASYLKVQDDTFRQREEVLISNGCSIDTYIFENFEPNPEDQSLRAKFRAFKFPDSNFVRFVGTVNVCIKQCPKVNCGGTRKKRDSYASGNDNDKDARGLVMTVSTVLRISNPFS